MRTILRESNLDLLGEVERLIAALKATPVVPELAPYHDHMVRACADLHEQICHNLRDMELGRDDILPEEILSETQRLARDLRLHNRLAGPALRGLKKEGWARLARNLKAENELPSSSR